MNRIKLVKTAGFIFSAIVFIMMLMYIWVSRENSPMNILQFVALEYCGIFVYTIYDKINKL